MDSYTNTIENMRELVLIYRYFVTVHSSLKTRGAKDDNEARIEELIAKAAANGMSKEELDELARVEW